MTDSLSPAARSANMAAIRSLNTAPEMMVRKALFRLGFRFRIAPKKMVGRPDIVLPKHKAVVFIHGCFWHGHGCPKYRLPKSNTGFWAEKVHNNKVRDHNDIEALLEQGWRVAVVWECVVKGPRKDNPLPVTIETLRVWLYSSDTELELPRPQRG